MNNDVGYIGKPVWAGRGETPGRLRQGRLMIVQRCSPVELAAVNDESSKYAHHRIFSTREISHAPLEQVAAPL